MRRLRAALAFLITLPTGCAADVVVPADCEEEHRVGDVCAGVPPGPVCDEDYWTEGVPCAVVHQVDSGASFAEAVGRAGAGTCIALAPGRYGAVILPDGVSLLGGGADCVTLAGIEVGGDAVVVRGMTIERGSLNVRSGATTAEMIRIVDSLEDGVTVGTGATLTLRASEVRSFARYGVSAFDVASVNIENSLIEESLDGPGLWVQCSLDCACMTKPMLSMSNVRITRAKVVGLSLVGADATLHNVEIRDTVLSQDHGAGTAASQCSSLTATDLRILDNDDYGLLIHDSSMRVDGLTVSGNPFGVWIQQIGATMPGSVQLRAAEVRGNRGIGIAVANASTNVTIEDSHIVDTQELELAALNGVSAGSCIVADGIFWKDDSHLVLRRVTVSGSQRQSILIDGGVAPGSIIDHVTLTGGDEITGILQQNFAAGVDLAPEVVASQPVTVTVEQVWCSRDD